MTASSEPAARPATATPRIGARDPVLSTLVLAAAAAALGSGFVAVAPNRLVSGMPIALWAAAGPGFTDRKSTRLNSSHEIPSRMPSSA